MGRSLEDLQKQYNKPAVEKRGHFGGRGRGPGRKMPGGGKPKNTKATISRLLSYIANYKYLLILIFFIIILTAVLSTIATSMMKPIINNIVAADKTIEERVLYLSQTLVVLGIIYGISVISTYIQNKLLLLVSQNTMFKIRNDLFSKLQMLPVRYFDSNSTGEVMSRFTNDVDNIDNMINQTLTNTFSGIVNLIATFVLMITTNIWLTIITIVFIPIFTLGGAFIAKKSGKYYVSQQHALGALNGYIEESVNGAKIVKVFNHEDTCVDEFKLLNDDMKGKMIKANFFGGIMGPIMGNTSQISYAITAGVGGLLCLAGKFDIGGLSVFVGLTKQFSMPINMISQQMTTIISALAGAERVFQVMDMEPEKREISERTNNQVLGNVKFEDVTFGYYPEKTILKNINLDVHQGDKIAFVGSTGAGKTTITNLLTRFYDIENGSITIDGKNIREYNLDELRENISMVLQDTHLFTGTIMENIRYGRLDATDEEVIEASKTASSHSFIMRLSEGYNTIISGDGSNISQGQRQLINIARAAVSKAPILVLDEATSSVDTRTERHIEHGMNRLMKNRTTFVIAHRLSTVRNAKTIYVLEKGEIIEYGTHDELLDKKGRYYELYTGKKELD